MCNRIHDNDCSYMYSVTFYTLRGRNLKWKNMKKQIQIIKNQLWIVVVNITIRIVF